MSMMTNWNQKQRDEKVISQLEQIPAGASILDVAAWILCGPLLLFLIAALLRKIDDPTKKTEFTIGYHVIAMKRD